MEKIGAQDSDILNNFEKFKAAFKIGDHIVFSYEDDNITYHIYGYLDQYIEVDGYYIKGGFWINYYRKCSSDGKDIVHKEIKGTMRLHTATSISHVKFADEVIINI